jgi:hypothetical protein
MAVLPEAFDPSQETGSGVFEPLPPGLYTATIIESGIETPKSGNGCMLSLRWKIEEGEHEGRLVFQRCVISHSSEAAQRIGRGQVKDLCDAFNMKAAVQDSDEFLHKTALIKLGIERDKSGLYEDKNKVVKVMPVGAPANSGKPVGPNIMNPAPKPATGAAGAPPWAR